MPMPEVLNKPCDNCGCQPELVGGPDIRFPSGTGGVMWRAQCSGDCLNPTYTRFTEQEALRAWNGEVQLYRSQHDSSR